MTKLEAVALWRILTVLAGYDEIIDVCEVTEDLGYLLRRLDRYHSALDAFDDEDVEQIVESLRAQIECNLHWHTLQAVPYVQDVPGCEKAGIT